MSAASTDMNQHSVAVTFDDSKTSLASVIKGLGEAGYTVPSYSEAH